MANNIFWVTSRPKSPEREEEFNVWYNHFHLAQMLKVPGVVAITRYKLSHMQMEWFPPSAVTPAWPYGKEFTHVAVYEVDGGVSPSQFFANLQANEANLTSRDPGNDPVEWGEQWFYEAFTGREKSVWLRKGGPAPSKPDEEPDHMFIVPISPLHPDLEEDFNRWYISQGNIRRPGFAAGVRYKLSPTQGSIDPKIAAPSGEWPFGQHTYLMIYQLYDPLAAYNDLRASVMAPRPPGGGARYSWIAPWGSLRKVDEHIVYEPITYRVTPIEPA